MPLRHRPIRRVSREAAIAGNAERMENRETNSAERTESRESGSPTAQTPRYSLSEVFNGGLVYCDRNNRITKLVLDPRISSLVALPSMDNMSKIALSTLYPGLLIGSGYPHPKERDRNDDFQLGFYFDHTTGMPVIPGSSIKGALRSIFGRLRRAESAESALAMLNDFSGVQEDTSFWLEQDEAIFGQVNGAKVVRQGGVDFFDAYIVATDDRHGLILADDYLAPHADPYTDPIPIRFLKVRPGVTFCFAFRIRDTEKIAIDAKKLFVNLLSTMGVGAKTNVGYGQLALSEHECAAQRAGGR